MNFQLHQRLVHDLYIPLTEQLKIPVSGLKFPPTLLKTWSHFIITGPGSASRPVDLATENVTLFTLFGFGSEVGHAQSPFSPCRPGSPKSPLGPVKKVMHRQAKKWYLNHTVTTRKCYVVYGSMQQGLLIFAKTQFPKMHTLRTEPPMTSIATASIRISGVGWGKQNVF